jgi:peptidoglycan/LPS O-acetylase OafA/YrhL
LGVEEQFYLVWPALLLLFISKLSNFKSLLIITALIFIATLVGEYYISRSPMFAYYMLPSRMGELLAEAYIHFALRSGLFKADGAYVAALGIIGLILVSASFWLINEDGGLPSILSLPPVLGSVLIIMSGYQVNSLSFRFLSVSIFVKIGLISYSLYLWHWPVLAYYRYLRGNEIDLVEGLVLFLSMIVLSLISYYFVERRYRYKYKSFTKTFY